MPDRVGYTNVRCILNLDGPSRVHKCTMYTKFWSRYDLQNFRKRIFLGDGQGELTPVLVYRLNPFNFYFILGASEGDFSWCLWPS